MKTSEIKVGVIAVFDFNFVTHALTLYKSCMFENPKSQFIAYCLDNEAADLLSSFVSDTFKVLKPSDFLTTQDVELKKNRSHAGFVWTVRTLAMLHLLKTNNEFDWIASFDCDMMFFESPEKIFEKVSPGFHACLTPHGYSKNFEQYENTAGTFNAGFSAFRKSADGLKILQHWTDLCVEWCDSYVDATNDRFGDQKYLDLIYKSYGAMIYRDLLPQVNLAPWNLANYETKMSQKGEISISEQRLILYHFQGMKFYTNNKIDLYPDFKVLKLNPKVVEGIYMPYIKSLNESLRTLKKLNQKVKILTTEYKFKSVMTDFFLGSKTNLIFFKE